MVKKNRRKMSPLLENSLNEKGPFDACLLTRLILSLLHCKKGDYYFLHACVKQGVPPREFPPFAENRVSQQRNENLLGGAPPGTKKIFKMFGGGSEKLKGFQKMI